MKELYELTQSTDEKATFHADDARPECTKCRKQHTAVVKSKPKHINQRLEGTQSALANDDNFITYQTDKGDILVRRKRKGRANRPASDPSSTASMTLSQIDIPLFALPPHVFRRSISSRDSGFSSAVFEEGQPRWSFFQTPNINNNNCPKTSQPESVSKNQEQYLTSCLSCRLNLLKVIMFWAERFPNDFDCENTMQALEEVIKNNDQDLKQVSTVK